MKIGNWSLTFILLAALAASVALAAQPTELNTAAPKLTGGPWINTATKAGVSLAGRRGKVTVLHFWTFG